MTENQWFYLDNEEQKGPHSGAELHGLHAQGVIGDETLLWRDGMADWISFRQAVSQLGPPPAKATVDPDSRECPFCGGAIKKAAKICKHCKQAVEPIALRPLTDDEQRARELLIERGLVTAGQIDSVAGAGIPQGQSLFGLLEERELLTPAQIENVSAVLKTQRMETAREIGATAVARMLVTQAQLDQVLADLEGMESPPSIVKILEGRGLITVAQAEGLAPAEVATPVRAPAAVPQASPPATLAKTEPVASRAAPEDMEIYGVANVILLSIVTLGIYGVVQFYKCAVYYREHASRSTSSFGALFWVYISISVVGVLAAIFSSGYSQIVFVVPETVIGALLLNEVLSLRADFIDSANLDVAVQTRGSHLWRWIAGNILAFGVLGLIFLISQAVMFFKDHNDIANAAIEAQRLRSL